MEPVGARDAAAYQSGAVYGPDALIAETLQAVAAVGPVEAATDVDQALASYRILLSCLSLDADISLRKRRGRRERPQPGR